MSTVRARVLAIGLVALSLSLGACSNSLDVTDNGNGTCTQERTKKVVGISYSTDRNFVNCDVVSE